MRRLPIGWSSVEEMENIEVSGVDFKSAAQVVRNESSFRIPNLYSDYIFIGPTSDLTKILYVICRLEDGFRKITSARKATVREMNSYFDHLSEGPLK